MSTSFHIRAYQDFDQESVLSIFRLNTPRYFSPEEENDLIRFLEKEIAFYFVVESSGQVVGSGGINFQENHSIGILSWDLFHPDFQRKSLGTELLKFRIQKLSELNILRIRVRTSQLVYTIYQKNGFQLKEVVEDYWAAGIDLYLMEYFL